MDRCVCTDWPRCLRDSAASWLF